MKLFAHVDASLRCAEGKTTYQLLNGRRDQTGRNVRIL
jgi:hypothetical protein